MTTAIGLRPKPTSAKWFQEIVQTIRASINCTRGTVARLVLECHHEMGSLLIEHEPHAKKSGISKEELVELVSEATSYSKTTIYDAVNFARAYPSLEDFSRKYEEISWNKVKKLIYKGKETENSTGGKKEEKKLAFKTCPECAGKGYIEA